MKNEAIKVLLIEDNPGDAYLIRKALIEAKPLKVVLECVDRLSRGIERLSSGNHDLVLLDLSLPDSEGLETFNQLREHVPDVPVIILTGLQDERLGVRAVQGGAEEYLVKDETRSNSLIRAVQYALERHRTQGVLRAVSMLDGLTGLYNRRGFLALADQQCRLADRAKFPCSLVLLELNDVKSVNAIIGNGHDDAARTEAAELLASTFRSSDVIARLEANQFVVFLINCSEQHMTGVLGRLESDLKQRNSIQNRRYDLSFSKGAAFYNPEQPSALSELLARAEASRNQLQSPEVQGKIGIASPGD